MRIDVHSHVTPPGVMGKAGRYGPERWAEGGRSYLRVGEHISTVKLDPDLVAKHGENADISLLSPMSMGTPQMRLAEMDAKGIDIIGVTIAPLFYFYWAEPEIGVPFAQLANDALAGYVAGSGGRLFYMATLPMQDVAAAAAEVDRALASGAKAINVGGINLAGRELDDEAFYPIWDKVQAADVPVFLHPYPEHLAKGAEVTDDYNMSWIVGYPYQEMFGFCRLILGGVFDHFPDLKVYITHGGGFAPYQWGRLVKFAPYMPGVKAQKPFEDYLHNFYFDVLLHSPRERKFLIDFAGTDNVVFGSNYGSPQDQATFDFIEDLGYTTADTQKMTGGNALRLFHLDPPDTTSSGS
jgi:aminocarboxymuconate-semialdehyde decarboxylase